MTDADLARPLATLVDDVQRGAKQAQFLVSIGKKDEALDCYLRTITLAIKMIPLHRDFPSLKNDRKQLGRKYNQLIKELSGVHEIYEAIKKHKLMKQQEAGETKAADDLKSRMAKLRNNGTTQVQDPRIRTQPPIVPLNDYSMNGTSSAKSQSARRLSVEALSPTRKQPPAPPPKPQRLTTNGAVIMPKLPDAIYSPARGGNTSHHQDLPSSTPRGSFSRQTSYFPTVKPAPKPAQTNGSIPEVQVHHALPEGDTVTVEELLKYQRFEKFRILFIDVRPRADYEEGHILSSSTICIEPDIIDRPGIEARDVEDSMVLGSAEEKDHFERRHEYDMIVIYDQDSEGYGDRKNNAFKLARILSDFDYPEGEPASKHPKLLKGGLDAWKDSLGSHALRNSGHKRRKSAYDKPWLRSPTKPIQNPEEAKRWEQHLTKPEEDDADDADEETFADFAAARSINDFLTRFPSVQESMTSPVESPLERHERHDLRLPPIKPPSSPMKPPDLPMPPREPTRPPPAVPRRSYSGLQPPDDDEGTTSKTMTRRDVSTRGRANGLKNPGNWCYANSTLQALFASGQFGEELYSNAWQHLYKPPKKEDEKILPPQLLTKIMANLFLWMGTAKFDMQADTLMQYLRHITSRGYKGAQPADQILGGHRQMDAHELLLRLFLELHDETNRHRDRPDVGLPPPPANKSILEGAVDIWNLYRKANDSIIDKYWQTLECLITTCETCGHVTYRVDPPKNHIVLSLPENTGPTTIENLLNNYFAEEHLEDYKCDGCGLKGGCKRMPRFARLPDLLCVFFGRFENKLRKNNVYIDFPHHDLDLSPYSIQGQTNSSDFSNPGGLRSPTINDHHFTKPFRYDAYAVIQHGGQLVGGHYVAVVREGPEGPDGKSVWRVADDAKVTTQEVGPGRGDPGTKFLFRQGKHWATPMDAYMVFYQRKDVGMSG